MSSKDSQKYIDIAHRFSSQGLAVLRFDFRGSGESEGGGNLLTNRIMDLKSAIEFAVAEGFKSIGVLGSSYGGATAILVARQNPIIGALVTWATPCQVTELFGSITGQRPKDLSKKVGELGEGASHPSFVEDLSRYNVVEAVKEIGNVMVLHCKGDKVVPWPQARMIYDNAKQPKRLRIFEGGDHQFVDASIRREAVELSFGWMNSYL
jgi:dipeptidyl aminopeptidase/acylaminoacyl peptidase